MSSSAGVAQADVGLDLQQRAEALGAEDLFLFRRVSGERFVHLGGLGRGVGWAGIVELELLDGACLAEAHRSRRVQRVTFATPRQVVGPYHASSAVIIPVSGDVLVVAGRITGTLLDSATDEAWRALAGAALEAITFVSPAKRLADELEVLHAVQTMTSLDVDRPVAEVLADVVTIAAESLSCELGLASLASGEIGGTARGWELVDAEEAPRLIQRVQRLAAEVGPCQQDADHRPLPVPLDHGVRSWLLLALSTPDPGWLLMVHLDDGPRGFTNLCQELGRKLAEAASGVLGTAAIRQRLRTETELALAAAERDHLTGIGNRGAWTRALRAAQPQVDAGQPAAVLVIDVDGLKAANDRYGHATGDRVITATAAVLSRQVDAAGTVARLGGDEFGLLLPGVDLAGAERIADHIRTALHEHPWVDGRVQLCSSIGISIAGPQRSLPDAAAAADRAMYAEKTKAQPNRDTASRSPVTR
ncbi:MAG TPA: GGDEF domain-containing protein [Mycobacteriales bacterium]|nr:GGDEF domain-containing protein [Mycobacteriales bacterium]